MDSTHFEIVGSLACKISLHGAKKECRFVHFPLEGATNKTLRSLASARDSDSIVLSETLAGVLSQWEQIPQTWMRGGVNAADAFPDRCRPL
jgi:hypothetical protein